MQEILLLMLIIILALCFLLEFSNKKIGGSEISNALDKKYQPWQNNTQIQELIKYPEYANKVYSLMLKIFPGNVKPGLQLSRIKQLVKKYKYDNLIYEQLLKYPQKSYVKRDDIQAATYLQYLPNKTFANYLDIGCADGGVTMQLADKLMVKKAYCADVRPHKRSGLDYHVITDQDNIKLPYADNFMDLITGFMVLHHVKNLEQELKEIYRVLKPGGLLFIREHDCNNGLQAMLIDVEHRLYITAKQEPEKDPYMYHYKNQKAWIKYIESFGFKLKKVDIFGIKLSTTRSFYMIFTK